MCRNKVYNKHFHYRTNSVKIVTNFFKLKKNKLFFAHFPNFWSKNFFPKYRPAMHNFSSTMAKFREISWSNSKKTPWQMSRGKNSQTLFHRIIPGTARGLTSTTPVDWHLKVKDKKCDVGVTKNYYITVRIQKISSIHKLIHQILGSHELNDHAHFWPGPPKNHWNNF